MYDLSTFQQVAAFLITVVAVARGARLLVFDDFPPTAAIRTAWVRKMPDKWDNLFLCPFCLAPYLALGDLSWFALAYEFDSQFWIVAWWAVNIWAAVSYLAAIFVAYDEPEG